MAAMDKPLKRRLLDWFDKNQRPLPWRATKDPYSIWISEVMLQQTTSPAVIPFYKNFLLTFPKIQDLAKAPLDKVLNAWAGLGYYSRARNLHKAAKAIAELANFPKTYNELIQLPGFGPYTSRSVSSIAFNESVGVLDGNTIRVLSRFYGAKLEWWKTGPRRDLQALADQSVKGVSSGQMNQALMELGASICIPQKPQCLLCPLDRSCKAAKNPKLKTLPLKKPKRENEIWIWKPDIYIKGQSVLLTLNTEAPFLKGQWLLPGKCVQVDKRPVTYEYKHSITHHVIYVQTEKKVFKMKTLSGQECKWVHHEKVKSLSPFSLVEKALKLYF